MSPGVPLDDCPELVSHHDAAGVFLFASAAAARILGRSPEALVGTSIVELGCEADRDGLAQAWREGVTSGEARGLRYRTERDGALLHVETSLRVVTQGEAAGTVVCVTRDVEDLVRAERHAAERLAEAELGWTHWDELVALVPGIVWIAPFREDGSRANATFISDYLERSLGYSPEEWLTTPNFWGTIVHPDDQKRVMEDLPRAVEEGRPSPAYRILARDGRVSYFQSFMRVRHGANGKPEWFYGLTLDVTTFKQAEADNAALLAAVRRASEEHRVLSDQLTARAREVIALSAPVIPLDDGALVMPLLGVVDEERATLVLHKLLEGIMERRPRLAILDLTGVQSLDPEGAFGLVQAARAATLLGSRVVLTGLRAEAARTIVSAGLALEELPTRATVQHALREHGPRRRR
ncbi:PAS domain-containing protein [Polyangium spumosum]|uniref:PAS domain-containing protein n=1 Tax=Polyangium spumosum TaxID=889282 RepID=A0A6N7Q1T6_9BACT|nr:PAS domain-containing protein [Polyangium spumosum]MRG96770.1 PAS domain-containing protein [Polyangium spumosum]